MIAGRTRPGHLEADGDGQHQDDCDADREQAAAHRRAVGRPLLCRNARAQGRRRLDLRGGGSRERDRTLLLEQEVGELGIRRDARFERRTTLGRERSVGEGRQLGEIVGAGCG